MNPTISPTFLEQLKRHSAMDYDREIEGNFGSTETTYSTRSKSRRLAEKITRTSRRGKGSRTPGSLTLVVAAWIGLLLLFATSKAVRRSSTHCTCGPPPFSCRIVSSCRPLLAQYGVRSVRGDQYAAELAVDLFKERGIDYQRSNFPRGALYLSMVPIFAAGLIEIPRNPLLIKEFKELQRRATRSGREIAENPRASGTDDLANAVSGAVVHAMRWRPNPFEQWNRLYGT